ncbi:hypothetical protein CcCBS67573_g06621 [Chytriomyces confervae]|uniref:BZIP domain-containing protein n=1 Tax=Chytriomyces confervae TaxID=246404 RepID=A0A507F1F9_9FUNG|nr:hypothetical protein CcCBS67573_g06621 [Chytriomyces confervae]
MSNLFDFSHILNAGVSPQPQFTGQGNSLQDEIDRFLIESAMPISTESSPPLGVQLGDNPFNNPSSSPFDFLFTFPFTASSPVPPTSTVSTGPSMAPPSPSGSDSSSNQASQNQSQSAKGVRGRKPKVLSEEEKQMQIQHRKEMNKTFAQVSRDRKRKHVEELEANNSVLSERVRALEQQNASLMARVLELTKTADFVGSVFKAPTDALSSSSSLGGTKSLMNNAASLSPTSSFSFASLWPFNKAHHSQQLYPLLSFFRRRALGAF